ncbi:hypothetical protein U1Q18_015425 [Sarracenia purpurea var. burkii]
MVDTKAEEDDDEGFGDFTFASFPNNAPHSDPINTRKSTADKDDDEWGDFVESPLRSEISSGLSVTQSPSNASRPSKPFDPFMFFSDHSTKPSQSVATPTGSVPSRAESEKSHWEKPKGALPLSIFGDMEQEEEKEEEQFGVADPPVGGSKVSLGDKNSVNGRQGSDVFIGLAFNDIIGNMYNQSQQIKAENGLKLDSNGSISNVIGTNPNLNGMNSNMNGLISTSSGLNSNLNILSGASDGQIPQVENASGLSSNSDLFAGNIDSQSPQMKNVSGVNRNLDLFAGNSESQGQQIKAAIGLSSYSIGLNLNTDLFSGNIDFDGFTNSYGQNNKAEISNGLSLNLNASSSNHPSTDSNFDELISSSDPLGGDEEFDGDNDGWEFKDASSELMVDNGIDEVSRKEQGNPGVTGFSSAFGNDAHASIDLFSASNGLSGKPREVAIGFDFKPLTVGEIGLSSDSFLQSGQKVTENGLNSDTVAGVVHSDESFGDFLGAFTRTGLKQDKPAVNDLSHKVKVLASSGKPQEDETASENHKGALPLSIFGDNELETDESLNVQDAFSHKTFSHSRSGMNRQGSNVSIHDLISNLYSQAGKIPSVNNIEKNAGNGLDFSDEVLNPSLVNFDDDFDDASWEFKDASSQIRAVEHTSLCSPGDAPKKFSAKLKLNNYVDFYCKLKDELSSHLDSVKEAQNATVLLGKDTRVAAIEKEIQDCKELGEENINSKEYLKDQLPSYICLNEFLEVLHKLKFQVLESEYHLSRRLHLAEKDLKSAFELMKHTTLMLNVLTLGSMEDQFIYISTWTKMISVCTQELKHGSWIWTQLVEKNLQSWILSEPRGKHFILALGEIYRIVVILGASTKLYKPWILSSSVDSTSIYSLLEECYTLWSSSGIEEALQGMSDSIDFEYHSTVKALCESINYIHALEEISLGECVFNEQVSVCRLSLLSSEAVPEMKMVFWNGKYYFLTLANLWANLIRSHPPELPQLDVGS